MKNILKSSLLLLGAVAMFTACSNDRDSNPTISQPSTFVLNPSPYAQTAIDLAQSTDIPFTWSQPNYGGFPVVVEYQFEVSLDGNFTTEWAIEEADQAKFDNGEIEESKIRRANYETLPAVYTAVKGNVLVNDLTLAMQHLGKYTEDNVPESATIHVRCRAVTPGVDPVYSNSVPLLVNPIYRELKPADPQVWFFTGANFGWKNQAGGVDMIPFYVNPAETYDQKDGTGNIEWTGLIGGEFKIIAAAGLGTSDWTPGICAGTEAGGQKWREPGGEDTGNITITEEGYWKLTVNTAAHTVKFEKQDITPASYEKMCMPGEYQGWDAGANEMKLCNPNAASYESHDWVAEVTFDTDTEMKFAAGNWDHNWGNAKFPYGIGTNGGENIKVKAGHYRVFFNDITGNYMFISLE